MTLLLRLIEQIAAWCAPPIVHDISNDLEHHPEGEYPPAFYAVWLDF